MNITGISRVLRAGRVSVVVAIVVATVVGCGGDDDEGATTSTPSSTTSSIVTTTGPALDPGCPETHPRRLQLTTDLPAEVPYLDDMTACTDLGGSSTWLSNESDMVWSISGTDGSALTVEQPGVDLRRDSFLAFAGSHTLLVPNAEVVVDASPDVVQWLLNANHTGTWLVHDMLADKVEDYGHDQLIEALSGGSQRRTAVLTCLDAVWTIIDDGLVQDVSSGDTTTRLLAGLGIYSSATPCASAWQQADEEVLGRFSRTATWGEDIARLGSDSTILQRGDDLFRLLASRLGAAAKAL